MFSPKKCQTLHRDGFAGDAEPGLPSPGANDARRLRRGEDDGMAQRQDPRSPGAAYSHVVPATS